MYKSKEKRREYAKNWIANRRKQFFATKKCSKCKSTSNLELDHRDPDKKVTHRIWSWSDIRRRAEIKKCRILCHKCHVDRHRSAHGTQNRYMAYRCRCKACTAANTLAVRIGRIKRKQ